MSVTAQRSPSRAPMPGHPLSPPAPSRLVDIIRRCPRASRGLDSRITVR